MVPGRHRHITAWAIISALKFSFVTSNYHNFLSVCLIPSKMINGNLGVCIRTKNPVQFRQNRLNCLVVDTSECVTLY